MSASRFKVFLSEPTLDVGNYLCNYHMDQCSFNVYLNRTFQNKVINCFTWFNRGLQQEEFEKDLKMTLQVSYQVLQLRCPSFLERRVLLLGLFSYVLRANGCVTDHVLSYPFYLFV